MKASAHGRAARDGISQYLVEAGGGAGIRENFIVERRHDTKHGGIGTQVDIKLVEHENGMRSE